MRKIIQANLDDTDNSWSVLCNDGTMWNFTTHKFGEKEGTTEWVRVILPPIPQDEEETP